MDGITEAYMAVLNEKGAVSRILKNGISTQTGEKELFLTSTDKDAIIQLLTGYSEKDTATVLVLRFDIPTDKLSMRVVMRDAETETEFYSYRGNIPPEYLREIHTVILERTK